MESFLRGHVAAFNAWGKFRVLLYDNLKRWCSNDVATRSIASGVPALRRRLSLRAAPWKRVARGNEKGRVKELYGSPGVVLRRTQPPILMTSTPWAEAWCIGPLPIGAAQREPERTVRAVFGRRKTTLPALPHTTRSQCSSAGGVGRQDAAFRFDLNDYFHSTACSPRAGHRAR